MLPWQLNFDYWELFTKKCANSSLRFTLAMTCDDHNYNFHVCLTIFFFRYIIGKNTHLVFMNCFLETDILFCCIFKQICNFPQNLKEICVQASVIRYTICWWVLFMLEKIKYWNLVISLNFCQLMSNLGAKINKHYFPSRMWGTFITPLAAVLGQFWTSWIATGWCSYITSINISWSQC